ncbi:coxsackievirus and adenovirus receptor homolog [Thalassophryne amazonica]|uniref:coxsackievirus and adenovirus receptor homolog n=1 Tax=Thalassophryne amazonica TaxID=390379 RepID=UPI001471BC80|nr:coxsackievirus and adenovirus receptor homolog [Thalassophryne amazonica]
MLAERLRCANGLQVTSTGPQTIQKAEGETATLGCRYKLSPFDTGELDIEWSLVNPDATQKDQLILSYTCGTKYVHGRRDLSEGFGFAAGDPSEGDASLFISPLSPAHSATYECKVKKSPGVDTRKLSLVVLVKPSVPQCWVEGEELLGKDVSLHCKSATGSLPLKYTWSRFLGTGPAVAAQSGLTGELLIKNHSQSFAGIYLCEVNNAVGAEHCRINLRAVRPPNRTGVTVGTVIGSLLLIICLLLFITILIWKIKRRPRYEKEFSNEIREDVLAPESRPVSRGLRRSPIQQPEMTYVQVNRDAAHEHTTSLNTTDSFNRKTGNVV